MNNVPVFVICGFLEGGKTTFIKEAIVNDPEMKKEQIAIISCEEGEVEFDSAPNIHIYPIDEKDELTSDVFVEIEKNIAPTYVIIEYNAMWGMEKLYTTPKPKHWKLIDQMTVIDAETFGSYFANMKSIFNDMLRTSTTVVLNRCTRADDFRFYKDSIKRCNPQVNILYVSDDEGIMDIMLEEDLPYDLNDEVIFLDDETFVTWYIDALDNPSRYIGKTVQYTALVGKPTYFRDGYLLTGNMVMTCCEDDMQFMSFITKTDKASTLNDGDYIKLRAEVRFEYAPEYGEEGPVLYAKKVTPVLRPK